MRLGGCRTRVRRGLTWGAATNMAAHASGAASEFFFFFLQIHADSALIRANLQNEIVSVESDHIGQWPKSALNNARTIEISFE